jgi:hypothetical protein
MFLEEKILAYRGRKKNYNFLVLMLLGDLVLASGDLIVSFAVFSGIRY